MGHSVPMKTRNSKEQVSGESEKHRALDRMIENLIAYCRTEEGIELTDRVGELLDRIKRIEPIPLNAKEAQAIAFIRGELRKGYNPSVRSIAAALGFRSSRSG